MPSEQLKNIRIAIIGPSGAGKSTLIKILLAIFPRMRLSISCTTKELKKDEIEGVHYFQIDKEKFTEYRQSGLFAEFNDLHDAWYGTLLSETHIDTESVIFDVDVDGARNLKKKFPDLVTIFIKPPSVTKLRERLIIRGRESIEKIEKRIKRYQYEKRFIKDFDYCLINDDLFACFAKLAGLIFKEQGGKVVAIDGTAASGKGTIAKRISVRFGGYHLDSGLIYRSITHAMINQGLTANDTEQLPEYLNVFLDTFTELEDASILRTEKISSYVADFSALEIVRNIAFKLQMKLVYHFGYSFVVAEGRDMTTHVFINAQHKFFVDCPLDIRAERRAKEFGFNKNSLDYHKIYNSLDNRDHSDMYRKLHPLKFVPQLGVRKIDNSTELDKTLEKIYKLIE